MRTQCLLLAVVMFVLTSPAFAVLVTFDDVPGATSYCPVPNGYDGLNWDNLSLVKKTDVPGSGFAQGVVSGQWAAYGYGSGSTADAIITGGTFNLDGAYFTSAFNNGLDIDVKGYQGASLLYTRTLVVGPSAPTWFDLHFNGIDKVTFNPYGGTAGPAGCGTQFVMDNFSYNATIPAPGALLLVACGTGIVGWLRRRRALT